MSPPQIEGLVHIGGLACGTGAIPTWSALLRMAKLNPTIIIELFLFVAFRPPETWIPGKLIIDIGRHWLPRGLCRPWLRDDGV